MVTEALTGAELAITQLIQAEFPRGVNPEIIDEWMKSPEALKSQLLSLFGRKPDTTSGPTLVLRGRLGVKAAAGFNAADSFVVNEDEEAPVRIMHVGANFQALFINQPGPDEDLVEDQVVEYYDLNQRSPDQQIVLELGGWEKAKTKLSTIFALMHNQGQGQEDGPLLVKDGLGNIFYVAIGDSVVPIGLYYFPAGWSVNVFVGVKQEWWKKGSRVFREVV